MLRTLIRTSRLSAVVFAGALAFVPAGPAWADLLPSEAQRSLNVAANGISDLVQDFTLAPFDDSVSEFDSTPGLLCPVLEWSADAAQTSSFSPTAIDIVGSASFSTPAAGCSQGGTTGAQNSASYRFVLDEPHELILTGTSEATRIRLREFSGTAGPILFERLATDPGGPISFSIEVPAGGYALNTFASLFAPDPVTSADFDIRLDVVSLAPPPAVPSLGAGAAAFLAIGMAVSGATQVRRRFRR